MIAHGCVRDLTMRFLCVDMLLQAAAELVELGFSLLISLSGGLHRLH